MKTRMRDCTERYEPDVDEKFSIGSYNFVAVARQHARSCDGCVLGNMHEGDRLKGLLCLQVLCAPMDREDGRNIIVVDAAT